ncbi:MAG: type II secretion system protein [Candidatus Staskawiczbacteria bacterium]|nr:type II secretion system protein [Candidatus Staskawiczbacteria bacterium]
MKLSRGFTLIEIIVVITVLAILIAVSIVSFYSIQKKSALDNGFEEFVSALKLVQNKTLSSESNSQYGVYLDSSVLPNKYVLFKGASYALRDVAHSRVFWH